MVLQSMRLRNHIRKRWRTVTVCRLRRKRVSELCTSMQVPMTGPRWWLGGFLSGKGGEHGSRLTMSLPDSGHRYV
jgi:hypothetical protein